GPRACPVAGEASALARRPCCHAGRHPLGRSSLVLRLRLSSPALGAAEAPRDVMRNMLGSLRVRLLLLIVLAVVPALALTVVGGLAQRRQSAEQAQGSALRLARLAAAEHGRLVEQTRQLVNGLAVVPAVRDLDPVGC